LGEGGYVPAPAAYLQELRRICDAHGILLIADEVQSGFGRTGKFFALEHAGVTPDILVMAKGLGSGMPISAIGARAELMAHWKPGTHGGTYGGGNAVAAAARQSQPSTRFVMNTWSRMQRRRAHGCRRVCANSRRNTRSSAMCAGWA
jgi:4-aminobutyrate aminotransferase-like enzyme